MSRSSQQETCLMSAGPNPTQSTSGNANQFGTVMTRVIPISTKCQSAQVGRDSGLGSKDTTELSSLEMHKSVHDSQSLASLSCEDSYPTVVQGPALIDAGTQFVTAQLSLSGHQSTTRSSLTHSLSVAEPECVMLGQQSVPVQQSLVVGPQYMVSEHLSVSGQVISNDSPRAFSCLSLKYPTQVASASDTCGSLPDYLAPSSVLLTSTFPLNQTISSTADFILHEEEFEQIVIHPYEHKEEFKEGQFDIVLVYSEFDRDEALAFREILTKFVTLQDGKPPSICVLDQNAHLNYINSRFSHMEEALRRSTYMFLFLTKDFCDDSWAQLQRDECLMESIHNPEKKWCVVPILTKSRKEADYQLPFGLRALKGVEISHMLRGKTLNSVDVNAIGPKDVDPFFLKNMGKMLNDRIYLKIEREKRQLVSFQKWLREEKHNRWKELQTEKLDNELRNKKYVAERQNLQMELEQRKMQAMATEAEAAITAEMPAAECICQLKAAEKARYLNRSQPLISEAGQKVATKAETTVEHHHHHYYGPVHQSPAEQTVYTIYGPVSNSQIGRENVQHFERENSGPVLLDTANLETDAPESIEEYIVVTEEASTSLHQDAVLETTPVGKSDFSVAAECNHTLEGIANQRPTALLCYADGQSLTLSSSSKLMHLEKDELFTEKELSPEVDRPQSLPVLKAAQNMLSHCCSVTGSSGITQNPVSSGTSLADASNSLQGVAAPLNFFNDPLVRPMAAVMPICQKSLPELSDDDQGGEMRLKLPFGDKDEEEIKLRSPFLEKSDRFLNVETYVTHTGMDCNNRKTLTIANAKCLETLDVAGQAASLKLVLASAEAGTSSIILKTRVEQDEAHLTSAGMKDVVSVVPGKNDTSGIEEKSKSESVVELAVSLVGSSSVDPICSQSQNLVKKQTNVGKGCSNESSFSHSSHGSTPCLKVTANHAAEDKSTCTVS